MGDRVILHSDLNGFYASVETMLDPALRGRAVAVCGSRQDRHGIVLAKSEAAKRAGVKTGMANWEAARLCPQLVIVEPHFEQYVKYSELTHAIYRRYSGRVEPFGMDECWIDMTDGTALFGGGEKAANAIRCAVKEELGLTVSVGVSFNKVFAKLGSDMKKPDAVTVIERTDFREKVWPLPAEDLLFVGRATGKNLRRIGLATIGDLARADPRTLRAHFGKNGVVLWMFANGMDTAPVMDDAFEPNVKSVGRGVTCREDLRDFGEASALMIELSQDVGARLRADGLRAGAVQIAVRDENLAWVQFQKRLHTPSQNSGELARGAAELFADHYDWHAGVRAITVRAIALEPEDDPVQLSVFEDAAARAKRRAENRVVDEIRRRFGEDAIFSAAVMKNVKVSHAPGGGESLAKIKDRGMASMRT